MTAAATHPWLAPTSVSVFFERYWQRRPLVVRDAVPDLSPVPLGKALALVQRDDVESRLVLEAGESGPWEVIPGPLAIGSPAELPDSGWSLLIHELEAHLPQAAALARPGLVPHWRVDDVMMSIAPRGGSVGPHVDTYDAFLIQISGRRRWWLESHARPDEPRALIEGADLAVLATAPTDQCHDLGPGDLIYIPPGLAHHGIALDPDCQTWSVGLRAPGPAELMDSFLAFMLDEQLPAIAPVRTAPGATPAPAERNAAGAIDRHDIAHFAATLRASLDDTHIEGWIGRYLTEASRRFDPYASAPDSARARASPTGRVVALRPGVRAAYIEPLHGPGAESSLRLFVAGQEVVVPAADAALARALADQGQFVFPNEERTPDDPWLRATVRLSALGLISIGE